MVVTYDMESVVVTELVSEEVVMARTVEFKGLFLASFLFVPTRFVLCCARFC